MEAKPRKIEYFIEEDGTEPVTEWIKSLKRKHKGRPISKQIPHRIRGAGNGNFGNYGEIKGLGVKGGELKFHCSPGFRVYYGIYENQVLVFLHGGTKKTQTGDIIIAKKRWQIYLKNKEENAYGQ